jgi:PBP1b-binding outer membrane lipoprotein LpoB
MKKLLILSILLTSCAARKVNKEEVKEKIETNTERIAEGSINYSLESFTIEPIDLDRPILVNGKSYFNTRIIHSKDTVIVRVKELEKVAKIEEKEVKVKDTERGNNYVFFILLLIVTAIILYKYAK